MFEDVYKDMPWHLREQRQQLASLERPCRRMTWSRRSTRAWTCMMAERDPDVLVFGEDVGYFGGVFRVHRRAAAASTATTRCFDAPITEGGIIGVAIGMGAYGLRPVVEIQFADYIYPGYDQIVSEAARLRYRSAGEFTAPMTVRTPYGGGIFGGQTHSQSPEALFTHVSGLKTVIPSNPYDAKGLLIAAIEDDDPVIFFEPKRLYNGPFDGHHDRPVVALGQASAERGAGRLLSRPARQGGGRARGQRRDRARLRHHGACRPGGGRGDRHRCRGHRSAHAAAGRHRHDRRLGQEDRPLPHRARGDAHRGFGAELVAPGAGALLLPSRGADRSA